MLKATARGGKRIAQVVMKVLLLVTLALSCGTAVRAQSHPRRTNPSSWMQESRCSKRRVRPPRFTGQPKTLPMTSTKYSEPGRRSSPGKKMLER